MHGVDLKHVRIVDAILRHRSFTRAAEELNVAQPWLSVQLMRLEDRLGFPLFKRNRKQAVEPTPQCLAFEQAMRPLLDAHEALIAEVALIRRQHAPTLMMGAPEFSLDIPERHALFTLFEQNLPDADLDIINGHSPSLLDQLRAGSLDVTLALGPFSHGPELEHLVIAKSQLSLLMPEQHPLHDRSPLSLEDLRGYSVGNFRRRLNPPVYDQLAEHFDRHGVKLVNLPEATLRSAIQYAGSNGVPIITLEWIKNVVVGVQGMALRPLADPGVGLELQLVKRAGDTRPKILSLWEQASSVAC